MRNFELEEAIRSAPEDLDGYEVYADWLLERGEEHGEAILFAVRRRRAHLESSLVADSLSIITAEAQLLRDRRRILGALGELRKEEVELDYDLGFLRAIRIYARRERAGLALRHAFGQRAAALLDNVGVVQKSRMNLPHVNEDKPTAKAVWDVLLETGIPKWIRAVALPLVPNDIEGQLKVLSHVRECTFPFRSLRVLSPLLHRLTSLERLVLTASERPTAGALNTISDYAAELNQIPRVHLALDPPYGYDARPLKEAMPRLTVGWSCDAASLGAGA